MISSAVLSPCGLYRYRLARENLLANTEGLDPFLAHRPVCWLMLNPSTADAQVDDPTVRRCVRFSRRWGYDRMVVANLLAYRSTHPKLVREALAHGVDVVGPDNDRHLLEVIAEADLVVAGWGAWAEYFPERTRRVRAIAREAGKDIHMLQLTQHGVPRHPLYLKSELTPKVWVAA